MLSITRNEFDSLRQLLHDECGINLHDDHDYLVETRLSDFAESLGLKNFGELYAKLQLQPDKLLPSVINLMTTNETLWFRDETCWNALEKNILPGLLKKLEQTRENARIWVAGCSTGQEAYSLAILIDELCRRLQKPELARRFDIKAMDISEAALETAREARYNSFEINRGLSAARRQKYFESQEDGHWVLRPNMRLRVHFDAINLTHNFSWLGRFDLILCRNVTIYFTKAVRSRILSAMANMLTDEGSLLIGATESLWRDRKDINVKKFEGCLYIRGQKTEGRR